jgi:(p)ppGpp synthase/HD superfamily hydrolase
MSGYPEHVVTAGLLHDILESSDTTALELRMRFGAPIARLVEMVSEDPAVEDRVERKARLRQQVAGAGPEAAAISAADKLSKVREYDASGQCSTGSTSNSKRECPVAATGTGKRVTWRQAYLARRRPRARWSTSHKRAYTRSAGGD